jgi:RND family efflux transporter MFP subunit
MISVATIASCAMLVFLVGCKKAVAKTAPPPPTVTVAMPIEREVLDYDEYTGKLVEVEKVEVRAQVRGYLQSIGFKDGDEVTKGQMLFQIDPKTFEAQLQSAKGQLAQVKASKIKASADVKRYEDLVPKGAATQQDLDRAIGQLGEAEGGILSAVAAVDRAQIDLDHSKIIAEIAGITSKANLTAGNLVGASAIDQPLTTIVRMDPMYIEFDVDQRAAQQYRKAALERRGGGPEPKTVREMNIKFSFGLASEEGYPHEAILTFIDNNIDPTTGTIKVRGETANERRVFKPGFFARIRVAPGEKYKAALVAERAIGTQQGQKYVLVVDDKNTVIFRPVKLGAAQGDGLRVVRSGISPGDRIVVNGIQRARPGAVVKAEMGPMQPHGATTQAVAMHEVSGSK